VYLHAGTRDSARALGLHADGPTLKMSDLPPEMSGRRASYIEDILCIYKGSG